MGTGYLRIRSEQEWYLKTVYLLLAGRPRYVPVLRTGIKRDILNIDVEYTEKGLTKNKI